MACCKQNGNIPVESDRLTTLVKYGAKSATNSLIKLVGMGSCSHELYTWGTHNDCFNFTDCSWLKLGHICHNGVIQLDMNI